MGIQAYTLTVVNKSDTPIYFKYYNSLLLGKNPCGQGLLFPENDKPIRPGQTFTKELTGLCIGACFSNITFYRENMRKVEQYVPINQCKSNTIYLYNEKRGTSGLSMAWRASEEDEDIKKEKMRKIEAQYASDLQKKTEDIQKNPTQINANRMYDQYRKMKPYEILDVDSKALPVEITKAYDDLYAIWDSKEETPSVRLVLTLLTKSKDKFLKTRALSLLGLTNTDPSEKEIETAYTKATLKWHSDIELYKTAEQKAKAEVKLKALDDSRDILLGTY